VVEFYLASFTKLRVSTYKLFPFFMCLSLSIRDKYFPGLCDDVEGVDISYEAEMEVLQRKVIYFLSDQALTV